MSTPLSAPVALAARQPPRSEYALLDTPTPIWQLCALVDQHAAASIRTASDAIPEQVGLYIAAATDNSVTRLGGGLPKEWANFQSVRMKMQTQLKR